MWWSLAWFACQEAPLAPVADGAARVGAPLHLHVEPIVPGHATTARVRGAPAGATVRWFGAPRRGGAPCVRGLCGDLSGPMWLAEARADADGTATATLALPARLPDELWIQAFVAGTHRSPALSYDPATPEDDQAALLDGVTPFSVGGALPSRLALWSAGAVPLVIDDEERALVAATRVNAGKALIAGHESIVLGSTGGPAPALIENAIRWMDDSAPRIGVEAGNTALRTWLQGRGWDARIAGPADLATVDVWFANLHSERNDADDAAIRAWVDQGGGLIAGAHAWWWGYSHAEPAATAHPGNHVLRDSGVLITTETTGGGDVRLARAISAGNGHRGLVDLRRHVDGHPLRPRALADATEAVGFTARVVPYGWQPWTDRIDALFAELPSAVPTDADPVRPEADPLGALALSILGARAQEVDADDAFVHPAAHDFPGAVPDDAARVDVTVTIHADQPALDARYLYAEADADVWRSTGLYAAPGEPVRITIPEPAAAAGLTVQIGAHTDRIEDHDAWSRAPDVTRVWSLTTPITDVASAFGGLIYVRVPAGSASGDIDVHIAGAVAAPWFRRGIDDADAWAVARTAPAPWAELEGEHLILTIPREVAIELDDPSELLAWWDAVLVADAWLGGLAAPRPRKERIVLDRQISAGWMHAGYPIMGFTSLAPDLVDLPTLSTHGEWGSFHELGHNFQFSSWHLPGATESTCNLWSAYVMESVVGRSVGHDALDPQDRAARIDAYVAGGRDFWNDWSVWTNLETWLQLKEGFGWELIANVQADYADDPPGADPASDTARAERLALRLGQAANADLGPFFRAWGWPLSQATLDELATRPAWVADPMNP